MTLLPNARVRAAAACLAVAAMGIAVLSPTPASAVTIISTSSTSSAYHNGVHDTTQPTTIITSGTGRVDTISATPAAFTATPVGTGFTFDFTTPASIDARTDSGGPQRDVVGTAPFTAPTMSKTHSLFSVTFSLAAGEIVPFELQLGYTLGILSGGGDVRVAWDLRDLAAPAPLLGSGNAVVTSVTTQTGALTNTQNLSGGASGRTFQFRSWVEVFDNLTANSESFARIESLALSVVPEPTRALSLCLGFALVIIRRRP